MREGFDSGAPELDQWLVRYSWQNQRSNNAVAYVSVLDGQVVGYDAIAVANVTSEAAPVPVAKGAPKQVPCLLLARLAVDQSMQGLGLGRGLLADVMQRTVGLADAVGIRALLVGVEGSTGAKTTPVASGSIAQLWTRAVTTSVCR